MRGLIVRIGATGAGGLLALGLLAGPSAASGSDKRSTDESRARQSNHVTCFQPEGKTQGRSLSDPDGTSNGGTDKPGCTRQAPWDADTDNDGNNGCGNDADREDDNNGNCGRRPDKGPASPGSEGRGDSTGNDTGGRAERVPADVAVQSAGTANAVEPAADAATTTTMTAPTAGSAAGAGEPAPTGTTASTTTPETQVLGETLSAPDTLARTGAGVGGLALLGGLLVGGGRLTVLARKLLRIG